MTTAPHRPQSREGFVSGLEGVVAAQTRKSNTDGLKGELIIGGYLVDDLAPNASFEEVAYLLLRDELPSETQLSPFRKRSSAPGMIPTMCSA